MSFSKLRIPSRIKEKNAGSQIATPALTRLLFEECGFSSKLIMREPLKRATPKPAHWIEVRLEDFILKQEEILGRLESFLSVPLARIPVKPEVIGRWKPDRESGGVNEYPFFVPAMKEYGYNGYA